MRWCQVSKLSQKLLPLLFWFCKKICSKLPFFVSYSRDYSGQTSKPLSRRELHSHIRECPNRSHEKRATSLKISLEFWIQNIRGHIENFNLKKVGPTWRTKKFILQRIKIGWKDLLKFLHSCMYCWVVPTNLSQT